MRSHFGRYLLVGVVAFALDYAVFWVLWRFATLDYLLANASGMLCGFLLSFVLNRRYVFGTSAASGRVLGRFAAANIVSLAFASLVLSVLVRGVGLPTEGAKVLVSALVPLWNFLLYRRFVFSVP